MKNKYRWMAIILAGVLCIGQIPGSAVLAASGNELQTATEQTLEGMTEDDSNLPAVKETLAQESTTVSETETETESKTETETESETGTESETETETETETESETETELETETESASVAEKYHAQITTVLREADGSESHSQSTVESENGVFRITLSELDGYVYTGTTGNAGLTEQNGVLTGSASADIAVTIIYEADRIGEEDPESGDGIPDRYQVTFTYETDGNGRILSGAKEVVTRRASDGSLSETAKVSPRGEAKVRGNVGYEFAGWIDSDFNPYLDTQALKAASFDKDTSFTAVFFITYVDYSYSIEYYYNEKLGDVQSGFLAQLNEEITDYPDGSRDGFALDRRENYPLVVGENAENVIRIYYSTDEIGGENYDNPDGIPDKYQVTFLYETGEHGELTGTLKEVVTRGSAKSGYSESAKVSPEAEVKLSLADGYRLAYWKTSSEDTDGDNRFDSLKELRKAKFTDSEITVTAVLEEETTTTEETTESGASEDPAAPTGSTESTEKTSGEETSGEETTEEETTEESTEESAEETSSEVEYELTTMGDQKTPLGSGFLSPESDSLSYRILFALTVLTVLIGGFLTWKRERHIRRLRKLLDEQQKK